MNKIVNKIKSFIVKRERIEKLIFDTNSSDYTVAQIEKISSFLNEFLEIMEETDRKDSDNYKNLLNLKHNYIFLIRPFNMLHYIDNELKYLKEIMFKDYFD